MAGQFLDPSNDKDVIDIQDKAIEMRFTKHGEMFSAKNMAKLATTVFKCEAEKVKGSHEILNNLKTMLNILAGESSTSLFSCRPLAAAALGTANFFFFSSRASC